jgi:hypothetical protein
MRVFRDDLIDLRNGGSYPRVYADRQNYQRGKGIGSIFSSIYSSVVPLIKSALRIGKNVAATPVGRSIVKEAKKTAMKAGLNVVNDALRGENVFQSTKRELRSAGRRALNLGAQEVQNRTRPSSTPRSIVKIAGRASRALTSQVRRPRQKRPTATASGAQRKSLARRMAALRRAKLVKRGKRKDLFG